MIKQLFLLIFLVSLLLSKEITPTATFKSIGFVNDFVVHKNILYVANDMGTVDVFDLKTKKIIQHITIPPVITVMNKLKTPNVISVDYFNKKLLILSMGQNGFRNVWIYENSELKNIVDEKKRLTIKEARFVDDERIIFGTFGAEIILHDSSEKYNVYKNHISQSTLADISLSDDKKKMVMSDESGKIRLIDVATSKVEKIYSSQNVDNVYKVAYNSGVIITAGQDRRVGVYQEGIDDYHLKSNFLVYCVGLSPDGITGAYSSGEESNIQIFNTKTKEKTHLLKAHKTPINQIKFINNRELFSIGSRYDIFYWKLD